MLVEALPDRRMDAVRIALARREWVDEQQMHALIEELDRFGDERAERGSSVLVARRNDFQHCNDAIAADVPHGDRALAAAVKFGWRLDNETSLRSRPSD